MARRAIGRKQFIYSTAPRQLIPLTMSLDNHRLWNPPAVDALGSRVVERDESGRLAKFASRFAGASSSSVEVEMEGGERKKEGEGKEEERLFAPEADLSFLEGETLQSPAKGLGKRDIMYVLSFLIRRTTDSRCVIVENPLRRRRARNNLSLVHLDLRTKDDGKWEKEGRRRRECDDVMMH